MRVHNTGYGRSRTVAQTFNEYAEGRIGKDIVFEKLRHIPRVDFQLVLHGVTVLRSKGHEHAATADSIINTIRHDLRGERALVTNQVAGTRWSIGSVENVAPKAVLELIVEDLDRFRRKSGLTYYDARGLSELMALLVAIKRGQDYLTMQHNHAESRLPVTAVWMTYSLDDAKAAIPIVMLLQKENGMTNKEANQHAAVA